MLEQELERRKKLEALKNQGKNPYEIESIPCNSSIAEVNKLANASDETLANTFVSLMARVVSWRQSFLTLRDGWEDLQIYLSSSELSSELLDYFNRFLDIGDYVYVYGNLFRTKKGVLTLRVQDLRIVSKCINPFPDQHYGIKDEELKVRNRVGRSFVDESFFRRLKMRSLIIAELRNYLNGQGYVEVETPILEKTYGGANAIPFVTFHESLKENFFLRIATEISLKKTAIAGFSKVYEIGKVFRNEGIDSTHNPEFTSLEIYTLNRDIHENMDLTEGIFKRIQSFLIGQGINWNSTPIPLEESFLRISISDLVKEITGVDFYRDNPSLEESLKIAKNLNLELQPFEETVGYVLHKIFDQLISHNLKKPTFVYGFHRDVSPLSKVDPKNRDFTLRYELYINGLEFANGFSELNDPDDQRDRFERQQLERKLGNKEAFGVDEDYLFSLQYGLPPTAGVGIGIDRLIMLFSETSSIKEVILFPQVKK